MDWPQVPQLIWENAYLGVVPALLGLIVSVPLGIMCIRWRWLYPPVLSTTSVLYAIPSLALFIVLIPYTGLTDTTVIIPLTLFSLCVLVPNVVDGLRSVPDPVRQAATAMGFGTLRRLVRVELPIAVPIVIAGLRVAVVASISLASVGQLIGVSSLGYLIVDGYQRDFTEEILVGGGLIIALALVCDLLLVLVRRLLTPWRPRRRRRTQPEVVAEPVPALAGGAAVSFLSYAWDWLKQPAQWHGSGGIPVRILEQLYYTGLSLLIAALIAVPLGILIGHTGRGAVFVVNLANAWRAIPTLGLLVLLTVTLGFSVLAWLIPLVVLGIPPILVNTYEGVAGVEPRTQGRGPRHGHDVLAAGTQGGGAGGHATDHPRPAHWGDFRGRHRDYRRVHRPGRPGPLHHRRAGDRQLRGGGRGSGARRRARPGCPSRVHRRAAARRPAGLRQQARQT